MPTGNAVDFKWYRYTDNGGGFWAVKLDKEWGDDADSGLVAFNTADPVLDTRGLSHPRFMTMIDPNTGRIKRLVVGTQAAAAWTTANYTKTFPARGLAAEVTYNLQRRYEERIFHAGAIVNKPEPTTV